MKPVLPLSKIEKILVPIFCVLVFITVTGIFLLDLYPDKEQKLNVQNDSITVGDGRTEREEEDTFLDDITGILPDNCNLNEEIPDISFTDESGKEVSIRDFIGKTTILTFWASWCPDCQEELPFVNEFLNITKKYGNINYILINKLDNDKETKDKAKQYLSGMGINIGTYYDDGLTAYKKLGVKNIPTTLFLDEKGIIRAFSPRQIKEVPVFEAYLLNTIKGSGTVTGDFVRNHMMDDKGGVHNIYNTSPEKTNKSEVLSESQGAMLEYTVLSKNRELFQKVLSYINSDMKSHGLTAWTVSDQKAGNTNALIDDLRIFNALIEADTVWGGYKEDISNYVYGFTKYGISSNRYVDFYDSKLKKYARRFTLCYGDLQAMSALADRNDNLKEPYENALKLVTNGKISKEFPLYYSWYNYKTNAYEKDDLNMAEAMITILHLAEVDLLTDDTVTWLKAQLDKEGIKARYTVDGDIVDGYNYDSTAVYALTAMIAERIGDKDLQGKALKKMEKMRIVNADYAYNGAFGMEDGSGITSFDQIMAMLAYEYTN